MTLADRLKISREQIGKSQKEMAGLCHASYRTWQGYEAGETPPTAKTFEALVKMGFNANWLLTGEGPMERGETIYQLAEGHKAADLTNDLWAEYVHVPRYDIAASAGGGAMVHSEQVVDVLAFRADWLKGSLGLSPGHAAVISVMGDSMEPYLDDGDLILVDTSVTRIENNAVYVIQVDGSLLVKRIQKKIDGTVIVKSDNEHYEPEVFRGEAVELLRVVGKMVRRVVR